VYRGQQRLVNFFYGTAYREISSIAPKGQTETHNPQAVQRSLSILAISFDGAEIAPN